MTITKITRIVSARKDKMSNYMKFEYEISPDDYVACQMLYHRLRMGYKRFKRGAFWLTAGILFMWMAFKQEDQNWAPVFLALTGAWWIYAALQGLFPRWYLRRSYPATGLSGQKFYTTADDEGFEVTGDVCTWRVRWPGVSLKGENKEVFVLLVAGTLFMFGKKYLTPEQQHEFRRLASLPTAAQ